MKKLAFVLFVGSFLTFYSYTNDIVSSEVTYQTAFPNFEDLDLILATSHSVRDVIDTDKVYLSENLISLGEEKEGIQKLTVILLSIGLPTNQNFI